MVQATFIKSAVWPQEYPQTFGRWEIAVAGRSNVGKSSLINALTNHRHLAKVSSTPGRTQLLNFFLINEHFVLCDLPGFGYAKVPLDMKKQWGRMMSRYFSEREPLRGLLVLLDARRDPGDWERELVALGSEYGWAVIPVVTKVDKLSRSQRKPAFEGIAAALGLEADQLFEWSAVTREGYERLWSALERVAGDKQLLPPYGLELTEEPEGPEGEGDSAEAHLSEASGAPKERVKERWRKTRPKKPVKGGQGKRAKKQSKRGGS